MNKSDLVQLQVILRNEFNFEKVEISSGVYALYNKLYPNLKDFINERLPYLINSEFEELFNHYDKKFFLNHIIDFFSQFFQRSNQCKFQESDFISRNSEISKNSLNNDKFYYKINPFFENLFIYLEDNFKLEFKLTFKESKKEGKENKKKFFILV
ncbi:hypothetical protein ES708_15758 [subsurface metagenome]